MSQISPRIKAARVWIALEDGTEYEVQFEGREPIAATIDLSFDEVEDEPRNGFRVVRPGTQRGAVTVGGVVLAANRRKGEVEP